MNTAPGSAVWRSLRDARGLTLAQVVELSRDVRGARVRVEGYSRRETIPTANPGPGADGLDPLATELTMPGRRLLDAIYDWPLASAAHLGMLLDMTEAMMKRTRAQLVRRGLVCQVRIGATPELRRRNGTRLCLSADGLRYIARRDRRRVSDLLRRWSITQDDAGDDLLEIPQFRLEGSKLRVLARELRHTDGVSGFIAGLAAACREDADWRLRQALPPHRWERWFRYDTGWRSIRPDATIELAHRGRRLSFLLEYEERARNPAPMEAKLRRYRRYLGAGDTTADFDGRRPAALFVFADEATASRFCALAARTLRKPLPMLVSSAEALGEKEPLGRGWRSPWNLQQGYVSPAAAL
ncbi:MAG: replication-relaxation family protein [Chloroflexota bacterium]|nr:replication-relaxation family protein [Chloroflexota bacterium]